MAERERDDDDDPCDEEGTVEAHRGQLGRLC